MFKTFFLAEIKNAFKTPMLYIFTGLMAFLVFGAVASENIQIGGSVGNVYKNAPHIITMYTTIMTIFGLLIATAFYNNAALRDFKYGFNEILFSTPLSKSGYFFGRFLGALFLATIPMLGVFLGVILGTALAPAFGWVDADRFGDFYLASFVNNYFLFMLPNMFFAGTIIYALANQSRNTVISFVGALLLIVGYIVSGNFLSDLDNETIGALLDPFGIRAYSIYAKYYTPVERNTLSPGFSGLLLYNRLIWIGTGLVILLASYWSFTFQAKHKKAKSLKKKVSEPKASFSLPQFSTDYSKNTTWKQFKSFFYINFLSITRSITFKVLLLFSGIILISSLMGGFEYYGLKSYPVTYKIVDLISDQVGLYVIIILVFFSGELVWRDRENKINEVVDATPHTSFVSLAAKALSLVSISVILHLFFILCGAVYQLLNGYSRIEWSVYLQSLFYGDFIIYFVWSGVMIFIQVLMNNKYVAYFVSILVIFVSSLILLALDVESNMVFIAAGPSIRYSDMNGFGPGLTGALWFNLYWVLFAVLCLFLAGALWNRGLGKSLKERIAIAKKQLPRSYQFLMTGIAVLWLVVAGFVYYNTQVLNPYLTSDESELKSADFEKKYKYYQALPLPQITDVKYEVNIFPHQRNIYVKANLEFTNNSKQPIDSIFFTVAKELNATFDIPNTELLRYDEEFGFIVYQFKTPLLPEQKIDVVLSTKYISKGFQNEREPTNIIENGTFINNYAVTPTLGYDESQEIGDKNTRKKYDLATKERMPELTENCRDKCMSNYLTNGLADYVNIETVISTSSDQVAIAPGSLLKQWTEDGRNYYHYKIDHVAHLFLAFISADYEVATRKWRGIDIEVYHDKNHSENVEMMMDAVERSLGYYIDNFGPYFHKQCRIVEFPRYATFAQAFPGTMPYSESIGFIINLENEEGNNIVDAVIAHEMAHQWWAHQVIGAKMQGSTLLSETFSEYSSLMTMKSINDDPMKMRDFLKYNHDRYLRGRTQETEKELPLYKVENQGFIHYNKGSVVLYALQDYIGEDSVNLAMREFLEAYRYQPPPYPTSLDFLSYLEPKVPDSLQYLITDWFKEITLYDNRMKEATYIALDNGKYEAKINIESIKIKADSIGNETKVAMNDWIDVGFFADDDEKDLMFQKRVKIDQKEMSFTFVLDSIPAKAAIDPRHLLIDRVYKDNIKVMKEGE